MLAAYIQQTHRDTGSPFTFKINELDLSKTGWALMSFSNQIHVIQYLYSHFKSQALTVPLFLVL